MGSLWSAEEKKQFWPVNPTLQQYKYKNNRCITFLCKIEKYEFNQELQPIRFYHFNTLLTGFQADKLVWGVLCDDISQIPELHVLDQYYTLRITQVKKELDDATPERIQKSQENVETLKKLIEGLKEDNAALHTNLEMTLTEKDNEWTLFFKWCGNHLARFIVHRGNKFIRSNIHLDLSG